MRSLHGKDTKERFPTAIGPETIRERFTVGHMAYRPGGYLKAGTGCMRESLCPRDDGGNGDAAAGFRKPGKRGDYDSERKLNQNEAGNNCRNGFVHHGTGDAVHFARHMVDHCGKMENKGREWAFQELRGSSSCTGCGVFRYRNGSYMDEPVKETEDWPCKAGCKEIMDSLSRPEGVCCPEWRQFCLLLRHIRAAAGFSAGTPVRSAWKPFRSTGRKKEVQ